ncbi:helix-turn-helix transcriptional regulator [Streptomyces sp. TE33382]
MKALRGGMTQEQLAEAAGVSVGVVRKLERGGTASLSVPAVDRRRARYGHRRAPRPAGATAVHGPRRAGRSAPGLRSHP